MTSANQSGLIDTSSGWPLEILAAQMSLNVDDLGLEFPLYTFICHLFLSLSN